MSCWFISSGYRVYEHGDDISGLSLDRCFVTSNHLDSADVPILMHKLINTPHAAENMMWIMDKSYRLTFLGWVSALHGDFFIKPGKQFRDSELERLKTHIKENFHVKNRKWVMLFPEGGFLEQRRKANDAYTTEHNLPKTLYVTLPRFGALTSLYEAFRDLHDGKT